MLTHTHTHTHTHKHTHIYTHTLFNKITPQKYVYKETTHIFFYDTFKTKIKKETFFEKTRQSPNLVCLKN